MAGAATDVTNDDDDDDDNTSELTVGSLRDDISMATPAGTWLSTAYIHISLM